MRAWSKDHDKDAKAFEHQAQTGTDPDIKRFAEETLAVIRDRPPGALDVAQASTGHRVARAPRWADIEPGVARTGKVWSALSNGGMRCAFPPCGF